MSSVISVPTLVELLRLRGTDSGTAGYTFLVDGDSREATLSYAELDRRARAIAAQLQSRGATGQRVLILYPPGLDYVAAFFGCLYAGAVAVPAYPPDPARLARTLPRLQAIVSDAQARFALTTSQLLGFGPMLFGQAPELAALQWLATDELASDAHADAWQPPAIDASTLAFLQYTSGSTGDPKGVMLTHGNLLANEQMITAGFQTTANDVISGWLPLYHDMGLIGNVLQPLYLGVRCVLMSPISFLQRPLRWLTAISRYRATTSGGPNFAYDLCVRKTTPEERAQLDLSCWSVAFTGAEPVRTDTLDRFATTFAASGFKRTAFYPCYGLAEATLFVSGGARTAAPIATSIDASQLEQHRVVESAAGRPLVGCGRAVLDETIRIVDPETRTPVGSDRVGEIWVTGPHVAQGYWGRPALSDETFRATLATGEGTFLRTGDFGFVRDGELYVTGRLKDLIIIRGRNHYPQDIESAVEHHVPGVRPGCSAAFSVDVDGDERLVITCELDPKHAANADDVVAQIRQVIAEQHELQAYAVALVKPGSVPKTSSGKIQRRACKDAFLRERLDAVRVWRASAGTPEPEVAAPAAVAPPTPFESEVATLVAKHLQIPRASIDIMRPLSGYGVDSLGAVELGEAVQRAFGVEIAMQDLLAGASIRDVARIIGESKPAPAPAPRSNPNEYPLSYGQQALWFTHQVAPSSPAYNVSIALRVHNALDVDALRRSCQRLVLRHAALRTTFPARDGKPIARVASYKDADFAAIDALSLDESALRQRVIAEANRPFDLAAGPLLRVRVFQASPRPVLLVSVHHIVVDMWSLVLFGDELGKLYAEETGGADAGLADLRAQYADQVRLEQALLANPRSKQAAYWKDKLSGELPLLAMPIDRPRPPVQTYRGSTIRFAVPRDVVDKLSAIGKQRGATLYMTFLAAYYVLLHRHSGQTDIIVGSPVRGRQKPELRDVIGYFVNMMPLRTQVAPEQSFGELLAHVRKLALSGFAHSDYPFFAMLDGSQPVRDPSYSPIFQTSFTYQKAQGDQAAAMTALALGEAGSVTQVGGLALEAMPLDLGIAQFDLALVMGETETGVAAALDYNTDLFDRETIERMVGHFQMLLDSIVADASRPVSTLPMITEREKRQILVDWQGPTMPYPGDRRLDDRIEEVARTSPDVIAVEHRETKITYAELDRRANQLAHRLVAAGVKPGSMVAVHLERSVEVPIAWLAAWKAGAAFVPIAPDLPAARVTYMLEDSQAPILVTSTTLAANLSTQVEMLFIDRDADALRALPTTPPVTDPRTSDDPAYVLYTSGSTGMPKGSAVAHRSLENLVTWQDRAFNVAIGDRCTQIVGMSFDISQWETWPTLVAGATLVCIDDEDLRTDPQRLRDWTVAKRVTISTWPTPLCEQMLIQEWPADGAMRLALTGGDRLSRRPSPRIPWTLVNNFGPSECTVLSIAGKVEVTTDRPDRVPDLGRPIDNDTVYLLEPSGQLAPIGVTGEIVLGGDSVGMGYIRRPDLTAEKFVPNPFHPGRMYLTGDLGRWLPDGRIEYIGRRDHQVKLRGFRIELGEIEVQLIAHPQVREACVILREDTPGRQALVAYIVASDGAVDTADVRKHLAAKLPDYMVPTAYVTLDVLPLTPNGKIDRKALPAPALGAASDRPYVAPKTPTEEALAQIFADVLRTERVGAADDFFELGGHSLLATQVTSRARDAFGVDVPVRAVFEGRTVEGLAAAIDSMRRSTAAPIPTVPRGKPLEASFAQQRLWFLDQLDPGSPLYNISGSLRVVGPLDVERLARSLNAIVARHEALRTTFVEQDGRPMQVIAPALTIDIPVTDVTPADARAIARAEAEQPFELSRGPLLRGRILRLGESEHWLVLSMHHIVSDGWSLAVLTNELAALYEGRALPPLAIQYPDYAAWQRSWLSGDLLAQQVSYWKTQLAGAPGLLELPTDRPRPPVITYRGATRRFHLPRSLRDRLEALGRPHSATLFMTLLAAFQTLLARYSRQDDICVGTPIANRTRAETEGLIGFFVNTLVMRTQLAGTMSFVDLLARVREVALGAYAHQDIPFEKLVEELRPERNQAYSPLFQVMFALQNTPAPASLAGSEQSIIELDTGTAKFDITLTLDERADGLGGAIEFNTDLFDPPTIERMIGHYQTLLESIVADANRPISTLPILTEREQRQILLEWNNTAAPYPGDRRVDDRLEELARTAPDIIAVEHRDTKITFAELDRRANQLAHRLVAAGIKPGAIVAVHLERSVEVPIAWVAAWKAGAAYLPIAPDLPAERVAYMLEDSQAPMLVTSSALAAQLSTTTAMILVDRDAEVIAAQPVTPPVTGPRTSDDAAYVLYTSGSTGRPKGSGISHRSLENLVTWQGRAFDVRIGDRCSQIVGLSFDISAWETWPALVAGATLICLDDEDLRTDPPRLRDWNVARRVTIASWPTPLCEQMLTQEWPADCALRLALTGGDRLSRRPSPRIPWKLVNNFGPSECTVLSIAGTVEVTTDRADRVPDLGKPIDNNQIYLLEPSRQLAPIGVTGEIAIGGDSVGMGYIRRPELTAEKFVPNPYHPGRMYLTGDLGRWLPDGRVEYIGRIDHQVKLRGFRIELGEIEVQLAAHPQISEAVVIMREDTPGARRLVGYLVARDAAIDIAELRKYLAAKLPEYMVPTAFVMLDVLPLTPNGKIDRKALPAPDTDAGSSVPYRAPSTRHEEQIAAIWQDVLGVARVGVDDDFFELGGHSLLATQIVSRVRAALGVDVPLRLLFEVPTVAAMAQALAQQTSKDVTTITPVPRDGELEVSFGQQRLWFLDQLDPNSAAYNITGGVRLLGPLDVDALRRGLNGVVARHESLRTTFEDRGGRVVQVIAPSLHLDVTVHDAASVEDAERLARADAMKPFDLQRGPLVRAQLLRLSPTEHWLLLSMHHIVSDGWSLGVFNAELAALYNGQQLAPLAIQYPDYAQWQRTYLSGDVLGAQVSYWKRQLDGMPGILEVPTDRPRPPVMSYRGRLFRFAFPDGLARSLETLSRERSTTLFMTMLAAFKTLLHRYTRQEDIAVGTPIAGRMRGETEPLIGLFINTLVLRTDLSGAPTFFELLARVRDVALGAYAHQDVPFERLVEELKPERNLSHTPLFQVMFVLDTEAKPLQLGELVQEPIHLDAGASQFDMTLAVQHGPSGLTGSIEYSTDLFDEETIARMTRHYVRVLESIVADPGQRISELAVMTAAEERQIVVEWNETVRDYPRDRCLHHLVEEQVDRTPDAIALVLERSRMTYRELDDRANQVAHHLISLGVGPETRVGICIGRSLDMMVALVAILKAGGAYLPLDPEYPEDRIQFMLEDAAVPVLITEDRLVAKLAPFGARLVSMDGDRAAFDKQPTRRPESTVGPGNLAYVIYTSGSTGKPKGVQIEHQMVVNLVIGYGQLEKLGPSDRSLQFSSIAFDGSVNELFAPFAFGAVNVLRGDDIPTAAELFGERFAGVTVFNMATAYWHSLVTAVEAGDLRVPKALRLLNMGGERALPERVAAWHEVAPHCVLQNVYGPAETTDITTVWQLRIEELIPGREVPIGVPLPNYTVYLLDANRRPVPVGVPGEIYIGGESVARGYLNRPELTADRFVANPFAPGRMYRTGDYARWFPNGNLEFIGRVDHQVKIRGFRIELGEIEAALAEHPNVRQVVVLAREDSPGDKRLVGYVVGREGEVDIADLKTFLRARLPDYMVPPQFVVLGEMPLTTNGKVNTRALPVPERASAAENYVAPRNDTEEALAKIWAEVLRLPRVGIEDDFFELGGHSLLATQVVSRVRAVLGAELPLRTMFEARTVADLAGAIARVQGASGPPLVPVPRDGELELSFAQQRLWFLDQLEPNSAFYNVSGAVKLVGALDAARLTAALNTVVARHESLRTTFAARDGRARQVIAPSLVLDVPVIDVASLDRAKELALAEAQQPFDLLRGPLIRARMLRLGATEHWLLLSMHHIISDGWSLGVLMEELGALYAGAELPPLAIQYADFAAWQRSWLAGGALAEQLAYWKTQLAGIPNLLELPTDRPRPAVQTYRGARHTFKLSAELTRALDTVTRQASATPFMTLLAAFQTLLHRYSGQTDIVVGTPVAGRNRAEIEGLVGFFVNTLVMRADFDANPTFRELLGRTRDAALGAYAHQDLPFEKLVEELHPERSLSHSPLFQVMFALQNTPITSGASGLEQSLIDLDSGAAQFDLTLDMTEMPDGIEAVFDYNVDLFDASTIERMTQHFVALLTAIAANPDLRAGEIDLLAPAERTRLLVDFNRTERSFPQDTCIHQLIEQQVARTPDAIAVEHAGARITYRELDTRANQLAHQLRARGVGPEVTVAICVERSIDQVVALWAILKAGGAYVPLAPSYPRDRLAELIEDATPALLIADAAGRTALGPQSLPIVDVTADRSGEPSQTPTVPGLTADHLAYVLYTSGSTGKPKGVMVSHRSLVNDLTWVASEFELGARDVILGHTPMSFDASMWELWLPFLIGARLVMLPAGADADAGALVDTIRAHRVTLAQFVPSVLRLVTDIPGWQVDVLVSGGEALDPTVAAAARRCSTRTFVNMYGPTETTVDATFWRYPRDHTPAVIPIGRPVGNTQAYVLDRHRQPVPVGVTGELFLGGAGVARGYLRRDELTATRFLPNPFGAGRLYATGDAVAWQLDGNLRYVGRVDEQVKIRGLRIEPGEIEAVLALHDGVREVVVVAREDRPGQKQLVAYVVGSVQVDSLRAHLKSRLPEYMVPSAFVLLDSMPLTPNHKLDRKALPPPGEAMSTTSYVAPRTQAELAIAQVFAELLGVATVGAHDDFFALGGHSLLAVQLMSAIKTRLGVALPLVALFDARTVETLARAVETAANAKPSQLVSLRRTGSAAPLIMIHPVGGTVFHYVQLVGALPPDRPCYAIQAPGIAEGETPLESIEAMARHYIELIAEVGDGPCHLFGWSLGGVIAVEMARQLAAAGRPVHSVVLLDSFAASPTLGVLDPAVLLGAFAGDLGLRLDAGALAGLTREQAIERVVAEAIAQGALPTHVGAADLGRYLRVFEANLAAEGTHHQRPYDGHVTLLAAKDGPREADPSHGFASIVTGSLTILDVSGDHYSMLRSPHVESLAQHIGSVLERADARARNER